MDNDVFFWLQNWYQSNCNSDWEHQFGVRIDTIDNPGWSIEINIEETNLEGFSFQSIEINRSEHNWIHIKLEDMKIKGFGGPLNLLEMVEIFRAWVISKQE
jgi:Immunity protein 53